MVNQAYEPVIGEQVEVDWGLDTIIGTVEAVRGGHVLVNVPIEGPDGETWSTFTTSIPRSAVHGVLTS